LAFNVTILGTSSMVPTRHRGAPAVLVEHAGEFILVDCGEGTQRQMNIAGKSRARIRKVLLTHWHGDHVGGLAPLLQTLFNGSYEGTLELWGPAGTRQRMGHLACAMEIELDRIRITELEPPLDSVQVFWANDSYQLSCAAMRHGVLTVAYAIATHGRRRVDMQRAAALGLSPGPLVGQLQRGEVVESGGRVIRPEDVTYWQPGRKLTLVTDTTPTQEIVELARGADVLLCESTYGSEHEDLASAYNHMTAKQVGMLARKAEVGQLVLTHFSQRYDSVQPLLDEARSEFPETIAAEDFLNFQI
jgi:ribonuclease Z